MARPEVFDKTSVDVLPAPELAQELGSHALDGVAAVEIVPTFDIPRKPSKQQLEDIAWYCAVA